MSNEAQKNQAPQAPKSDYSNQSKPDQAGFNKDKKVDQKVQTDAEKRSGSMSGSDNNKSSQSDNKLKSSNA